MCESAASAATSAASDAFNAASKAPAAHRCACLTARLSPMTPGTRDARCTTSAARVTATNLRAHRTRPTLANRVAASRLFTAVQTLRHCVSSLRIARSSRERASASRRANWAAASRDARAALRCAFCSSIILRLASRASDADGTLG